MYSALVQYCWVNFDSPVYNVLNEYTISTQGMVYALNDYGLYTVDAKRIIEALPLNFVVGAPYVSCMCVVRNESGRIVPAYSTFFLPYRRQRTSYALLLSNQQ